MHIVVRNLQDRCQQAFDHLLALLIEAVSKLCNERLCEPITCM
jgi:hypothetical protein